MRTSVFFLALVLILILAASQKLRSQGNMPPVQEPQTKPVVLPNAKIKPGNIKPIDPD